jgi:hypothetical protein
MKKKKQVQKEVGHKKDVQASKQSFVLRLEDVNKPRKQRYVSKDKDSKGQRLILDPRQSRKDPPFTTTNSVHLVQKKKRNGEGEEEGV